MKYIDSKHTIKHASLLMLFGLLVAITTTFVNYRITSDNLYDSFKKDANHETKMMNIKVHSFIGQVEQSIDALKNSKYFKNYIKEETGITKYNVNELFLHTINENIQYFQVRYLDEKGMERIRVERNKNDKTFIKSDDFLQDKSTRYYFKETAILHENDYWYSKLDLNEENGKLEMPIRSTYRIATPVYDNNIFRGIIIINISMNKLLTEMINYSDKFHDIFLADDKGYIIKDPSGKYDFSYELGIKKTIFDLFPDISKNDYKNDIHFETNNFVFGHLPISNYGKPIDIIMVTKPILFEEIKKNALYQVLEIGFYLLLLTIPMSILIAIPASRIQTKLLLAQKENERRREEAEELAKTIDDTVIMSRTDLSGRITYVSKAFCKISGYTKEELLNSTHRIVKHFETDPAVFEDIWKTIKDNRTWKGKIKNKKKDGSEYWVEAEISPYFIHGTKVGYTAIRQDITNLFKLDELEQIVKDRTLELEKEKSNAVKMKELADNANRAKSDFLANMSHEIRTPLNSIIGLTNHVLETNLNSDQKDYLSKVKQSSEALLNIINDILDYSKIEAGKLSIVNKQFSFFELLDNISTLFSLRIHEKNLDFNFDIDPKIPDLLVSDSLRLFQVLTNLLGNSIKFTKSGFIALKIKIISKDDTNIKLEFCIEDSGIGITQENQKKLFNAFEQADNSITREFGGTGLGLMISKQLLELMNGKIWLESTHGVGSKFCFTLDLGFVSNQQTKTIEEFRDNKFLVLEDNDIDREYICNILKSWYINPVEAKNGEEALELIEKETFNYLLCDWKMPKIDGLTFLERLQERDLYIPHVLMLTAYNKQELLEEASKKSILVEKIIEKPYSPSTLYNSLFDTGYKINQISPDVNIKMKLVEPKQALLVEDIKTNQLVARLLLEKYDFIVTIAENGLEAVNMVKDKDFDIIFMDLHMPIMDGYEATKIIKEFNSSIPIVALSAAAMEDDKKLSLASGMNDHVNKPIIQNELEIVIKKYFELKIYNPDKQTTYDGIDIQGANIASLYDELQVDKDAIYEMYANFQKNYANNIDIFEQDTSSQEFKDFIHKLKGISGNLKINSVFELAKKLHDSEFNENDITQLKKNLIKICNDIKHTIFPLIKKQKIASKEELNKLIINIIDSLENFNFIKQEILTRLFSSLNAYEYDTKELEEAMNKEDEETSIEILEKIQASLLAKS